MPAVQIKMIMEMEMEMEMIMVEVENGEDGEEGEEGECGQSRKLSEPTPTLPPKNPLSAAAVISSAARSWHDQSSDSCRGLGFVKEASGLSSFQRVTTARKTRCACVLFAVSPTAGGNLHLAEGVCQ